MGTSDDIPEEWLESFNARMSSQGVPHSQRPWLALMEWTRVHHCTISGGSPLEKKLFDWFHARSPPDSQIVPPIHEGAFYFDSAFWRIRVPQIYGSNLSLNIAELIEMPDAVKTNLFRTSAAEEYRAIWADCFDYSYGLDDNKFQPQPAISKPFLASAHQQLSAATGLLLKQPAEPKAMESSRMAVEMFLKAYLCIHHGVTEDQARKNYSHNLDDALQAIHALAPACEIQRLSGHLAFFPAVGERYAGKEYTGSELWRAYRTALYTGACVMRSISTRNMRHDLGIPDF
jgi:hypothetical protein